MKLPAEILAGRRAHEPKRDSTAYARLLSTGSFTQSGRRPLIKPTPQNIRTFAKTTFARRAINRIKDPIANLPWEIAPKAGIKLNSELQRQIDIATNCFKHPNEDDSARSFLEQIIEDLLINGAGVYEHQLGGDKDHPLWCWPVDTLSIQINPRWSGKDSEPRYYQALGYGNIGGVQGAELRNSELVYIRKNPSTENPFGLGPLEVAFQAVNRRLGVADYAGKLASNAQPENLMVVPGMDNDAMLAFRAYWRNDIEGQGQLPIIGAPLGSKPELLNLHATDDKSLFIAYQNLLTSEIATSFDINPMSLGIHGSVNRATAEVIDDADHDNAIVPTATLIAAYISRESIEGRLGFSQLEFRFGGLNREDKLAEAQIYAIEFANGASTPNEYRARNNMPPLDNDFADLTGPDVEIAKAAARGAAQVDDAKLKDNGSSNPQPKPGKPKGK